MRLFLDTSVLLAAAGSVNLYGMRVLLPCAFLEQERAVGRL